MRTARYGMAVAEDGQSGDTGAASPAVAAPKGGFGVGSHPRGRREKGKQPEMNQ